jgi:hypothetical protein
MIPSEHTFPCPDCSLPVDGSDEDNYCSKPLGFRCQNCKKVTIWNQAIRILEKRDGRLRMRRGR